MCRLTKKFDGSNGREYVPLSSFAYILDQDAVNKLGHLEDFEECVEKDFEEYLWDLAAVYNKLQKSLEMDGDHQKLVEIYAKSMESAIQVLGEAVVYLQQVDINGRE